MSGFTFDVEGVELASGDAAVFVRQGSRIYPLGEDISGVRSIDRALTVASGRRALAEAILRRLTTPRGGLVGSPAYGYDALDTIGASVPAGVVEQRVLEQVLAEEEVEDARCSVAFDARLGSMTILVEVTEAGGPFELTLTSDQFTVSALVDGLPLFEEEVV